MSVLTQTSNPVPISDNWSMLRTSELRAAIATRAEAKQTTLSGGVRLDCLPDTTSRVT